MKIDPEKIKTFRRLYVATRQLQLKLVTMLQQGEPAEQSMEKAIESVDKLIGMLPMKFPVMSLRYTDEGYNVFRVEGEEEPREIMDARLLLINLEDEDDEPTATLNPTEYSDEYIIPGNTEALYETSALTILEDWKFQILDGGVALSTDPGIQKKYLPRALAQATRCLSKFSDKEEPWAIWEINLYMSYSNKIGWYAYLEEEDPATLEQVLLKMENGYKHCDWGHSQNFNDIKTLLLLKLGRTPEVYPYIRQMFGEDPYYPVFLHLKTDPHYVTWLQEEERKEKEAELELQKEYQTFLLFVKEKQSGVIDVFDNPEHPLVVKHAVLLNLIKERMVFYKLHEYYRETGWITTDAGSFKKSLVCNKRTVQELEQFEAAHGFRLPEELKVYLMEIGEGGKGYFFYSTGIRLFDRPHKAKELMQRPFPVTPDQLCRVDKYWGMEALRCQSTDGENVESIFRERGDDRAVHGLYLEPEIPNGCLYLGRACSLDDELYLIMNGVFEGEVWVNTIQDPEKNNACFGAASAQRLTFLSFIAESLLAKQQGYANASDQGVWL